MDATAKFCRLFLWRAHGQSGFKDSIRRMQCDHKPMIRRKRDVVCQEKRSRRECKADVMLWPGRARPGAARQKLSSTVKATDLPSMGIDGMDAPLRWSLLGLAGFSPS